MSELKLRACVCNVFLLCCLQVSSALVLDSPFLRVAATFLFPFAGSVWGEMN